ncbi:MAG: helix-turn-helix transcriptional regulator [Kangiellaceae bacterium]|nr:helix-turn-helix transcriptional regulator [Kangiellaceae bacterium]MCW8997516.1 helix-turn-helix transcriptional regulator [Kangiellaceae bacterium]
MNFEQMTDQAIATELGHRIEQRRLEKNLTQQEVADEVGLSRISYRKLEVGEGKLVNFIAVLRVLGQVASLENLIPESVFSPMEQLKLKGKVRKRASKNTTKASQDEQELDW